MATQASVIGLIAYFNYTSKVFVSPEKRMENFRREYLEISESDRQLLKNKGFDVTSLDKALNCTKREYETKEPCDELFISLHQNFKNQKLIGKDVLEVLTVAERKKVVLKDE